jgi:hypothetical protein
MGRARLSIRILHQNCDPELAEDRTLPYTAYVVQYESEGSVCYDIVIPNKRVDIFDHYWDRYREGLKGFKQTEGRVNPKMWGNTNNDSKNKKR